jgi:hypothetical protein
MCRLVFIFITVQDVLARSLIIFSLTHVAVSALSMLIFELHVGLQCYCLQHGGNCHKQQWGTRANLAPSSASPQ